MAISIEQRTEYKDTIKAPQCGKRRIDIYQLQTKWHIESHIRKRKNIFFKNDEVKDYNIIVNENLWRYFYKLMDPVPECGRDCLSQGSYNGVITLETDGGNLTLPGNISEGSATIYGTTKQFMKGDSIKLDEMPLEISGNIISKDKEAKVIDLKILSALRESTPKLVEPREENVSRKQLGSYTPNSLIFVSYASEDSDAAFKLYEDLKTRTNLEPWLDKKNLLPGQDWNLEIRKAIERSRYFIALFSSTSVGKRGYVQKEFKRALDVLDEFPEGEIFAIPVRLDDCEIPYGKFRGIQSADLFPDWNAGIERLVQAFHINS